MIRVALYGKPGSGKSTFRGLLTESLEARGMASQTVRLGTPLYELQSIVYAMAGRPMVRSDQQDGQLLNSLGGHIRRISPTALTDMFERRVDVAASQDKKAALICDDMRAADLDAVVALGFTLVEISVTDSVRRQRKAERDDLTAGDDDHPTEAPIGRAPDYRVSNDGRVDDLRRQVTELVEELLP